MTVSYLNFTGHLHIENVMESLLKGLSKCHHAMVHEYEHLKQRPRAHLELHGSWCLTKSSSGNNKSPWDTDYYIPYSWDLKLSEVQFFPLLHQGTPGSHNRLHLPG